MHSEVYDKASQERLYFGVMSKNRRYRLSVCIPTFCSSNYIDILLKNELEYYQDLNMSMWIMDSSPDDDTFNLVESYKKKYSNLFYCRFPADIHSNEKVYRIFQMAEEEIDCDYLWVRSDVLLCDKFFLYSLMYYFEKEYDFIFTITQGKEYKQIIETHDKQFLFEEFAWRICLYGAAILNVQKVLANADWVSLEKKYLTPKLINFSHVCLYFEHMAENSFNALIIDVPCYLYHDNGMKKRSTWNDESLELWLEKWPAALNSLPDEYNNKLEAIQAFGKYGEFFEPYNLLRLHEDGILTPESYEKYHDSIVAYSGVPSDLFFDASHGVGNDCDKNKKEYSKLLSFCKKHKKRVIYGCGMRASRYAGLLIEQGVVFDGFIVSDGKESCKKHMDHKVISLHEYDFDNETGIILGLNLMNQMEVKDLLKQRISLNNVFSYPFIYERIVAVDTELREKAEIIKKRMLCQKYQ